MRCCFLSFLKRLQGYTKTGMESQKSVQSLYAPKIVYGPGRENEPASVLNDLPVTFGSAKRKLLIRLPLILIWLGAVQTVSRLPLVAEQSQGIGYNRAEMASKYLAWRSSVVNIDPLQSRFLVATL